MYTFYFTGPPNPKNPVLYLCYGCKEGYDELDSIVEHCVQSHPYCLLKYRHLLLNDKTGEQQEQEEQEHILYWFEHRFLTKWLHNICCGEKYSKYIRGYSAHMDISQHLHNTNTSLLVSTYYEFC
jgi:hypothetical protein